MDQCIDVILVRKYEQRTYWAATALIVVRDYFMYILFIATLQGINLQHPFVVRGFESQPKFGHYYILLKLYLLLLF